MRLLLINARRGLGNRLRAVLSGWAFADASGCSLRVMWLPNSQCGARLDDLWHHPFHELPLNQGRLLAAASGGWVDHLGEGELDLTRFRRPTVAVHAGEAFDNPAGIHWYDRLERLAPVAAIRDRVEATSHDLAGTGPLVGVMVRAHASAHAATAASDPVDYALRRLDEIRAASPHCTVFLSSDSPEASEFVRSRHDVVELADKGEFNSVRGVQDAVCDLYLLASCGWIVGSHASSFSEIAGLLARHGGYETPMQQPAASLAERLAAPRRRPDSLWTTGAVRHG